MSKAIYTGVNGVARKVKKPYIGVGNKSRKVKKGYVGVNGVARQFYASGEPLSEIAVGKTVYMNVNGVPREFIVVHHGTPSSLYDSSCNGTWLLTKDAYDCGVWDSTNNDYANSDIHTYLNNTFYGLLDSGVRSIVKQVKIPYHKGTGTSGSVSSGANGLSTKIFLPSCNETGANTSGWSTIPSDGVTLSYFVGTVYADPKRICYYNGTAINWWTRSPHKSYTNQPILIDEDGAWDSNMCYTNASGYKFRPMMILPFDTFVSSELLITGE